jgi:hypothetical protein
MRALALGLVLLAGCRAAPLVAPLNYEPVEAAPEEAFRLAPPDASPVPPKVALAFHVSTLANGLTARRQRTGASRTRWGWERTRARRISSP